MAAPLGTVPAPFPAGVDAAFTTRTGGVSRPPWDFANLALHVEDDPARVATNRDLLARQLSTGPVLFPQQVHGAGVLVVDPAYAGEAPPTGAPGVDALVTTLPGVAVGVLAADCAPVLLADPTARVVGAAHAGRQGLVAGVVERTVEAMIDLGAHPERIVAAVGPTIGGCCYEVPAALRDEVERAVPGTAATTRAGTPAVDVAAGVVAMLGRLGVGSVSRVGGCTYDDPRWYSYRRDRRTGRHAGVVVLR